METRAGTKKNPTQKTSDGVTKTFKKLEVDSFKECITAFSKNLELKSSTCEELQDLFFKLAKNNRSLPENVESRMVDTFITVLVRVISVNYGCPIALEGLSVLLTYLKSDDRVFGRFHPTRELMLQLNFDRYLTEESKEAKALVLEFMCFLLRHYNNLEYSDLTSDPETFPKIRKAEVERIWTDIESLAINQENMLRTSEQNQQVTSNAFSELFSYIENIKKSNETSLAELRSEVAETKQLVDSKGIRSAVQVASAACDVSAVNKLESCLMERMAQMQKHAEIIMSKVINLETKHEETTRKTMETLALTEGFQKSAQYMTNAMDFETQLMKDVKNILLSRMSKIENDISLLANRYLAAPKSDPIPKGNSIDMANLHIDLVQHQIDTEILPKIDQIELHMGALIATGEIAKISDPDSASTFLEKLERRNIYAITELVKSGMESSFNDVSSCKKGLGSIKEQLCKLEEEEKKLKGEVQKKVEEKSKAIEANLKTYNDKAMEQFRLTNEKIKQAIANLENLKKEAIEQVKIELKGLMLNTLKADHRIAQIENEEKKFVTKLNYLEEKAFPLADKIASMNDIMAEMKEKLRALTEHIQVLETRATADSFKKEVQVLRDEATKRIEQFRAQMQGYFDSSWAYLQQFADLHIVDKINELRSLGPNYTAKLNCLEWLIRYHEYLSEKSSFRVIEAFKEIIHPSRIRERTAYSSAKHSSDIMNQIAVCIRKEKKVSTSEELKQVLSDAATYMAILEITLINDQNVDKAITLGIPKDLVQYLMFFRSTYDFKKCIEEFKLTLRCLTYCFRNMKAIDLLLEVPNGVNTVVTLMQTTKDEEIIANTAKIIRVCLRGDKHYDKVIKKVPSLLSIMLQLITTQGHSNIILDEVTAVLRNYTRKTYVLEAIEDPNILGLLCKLVMSKGNFKYKEYTMGALKNCCKCPRLLNYIKQTPAYEITMQTAEEAPSQNL